MLLAKSVVWISRCPSFKITELIRGKIGGLSVPLGVHNTPRYATLITPQNAIRSEQFHVATLKGSRSAPKWSDVLSIQNAWERSRLSTADLLLFKLANR